MQLSRHCHPAFSCAFRSSESSSPVVHSPGAVSHSCSHQPENNIQMCPKRSHSPSSCALICSDVFSSQFGIAALVSSDKQEENVR